MTWKVDLLPQAEGDLGKLDPQDARRISRFLFERVAKLENPRSIGEALHAADAVQALVECSNICFEPTFTFQLADWRYSKRGNHNQHIAIIAVHQH